MLKCKIIDPDVGNAPGVASSLQKIPQLRSRMAGQNLLPISNIYTWVKPGFLWSAPCAQWIFRANPFKLRYRYSLSTNFYFI